VIFQTREGWLSAVVIYEYNVRVLDTLHSADPKNADLTSDLASAHRDLATAAAEIGNVPQARKTYTDASVLFEEALRINPAEVGITRDASHNLQREAAFLDEQGDRMAALEQLDRAVVISDSLVRQRGADEAKWWKKSRKAKPTSGTNRGRTSVACQIVSNRAPRCSYIGLVCISQEM
jgi:tetratricopeptide (TPR) repeat protein